MNALEIKLLLLEYCNTYIDSRIELAAKGIQEARESANNDSKSSMGDKYETSKAMAHLEQEKLATQLEESYKLKRILSLLDPNRISAEVEFGSLVLTNLGNFYVSIGIGQHKLPEMEVFLIGTSAPLIKVMLGKKQGDKILFNGRSYEILEVY